MGQVDPVIAQHLTALEESLWRAETRFDDRLMDRTFAPDLIEFGRSGRIYGRAEMLIGAVGFADIDATLPLKNLNIRLLSNEIAQVTYISEVRYASGIERANRSSLWRHTAEGWQLCFHQGTPV